MAGILNIADLSVASSPSAVTTQNTCEPKFDTRKLRVLSFVTCDNHSIFISCPQGFRRKFVRKNLNTPDELSRPFNDPSDGHLCYCIHGEGQPGPFKWTCQLSGECIIQPPADRHPNLFNTIYWPRCDGTYQNAFDDMLRKSDGTPRLHVMYKIRLKDVLEPFPLWGYANGTEHRYQRDLARYDECKDAFVTRIF